MTSLCRSGPPALHAAAVVISHMALVSVVSDHPAAAASFRTSTDSTLQSIPPPSSLTPSFHKNPPTYLRVTALTPRMHNTRSHRVRPQTTQSEETEADPERREGILQLWGPSFKCLSKAISSDHRDDGTEVLQLDRAYIRNYWSLNSHKDDNI